MLETWFTDPESAYNLEANFKVLEANHGEFIDAVGAFARANAGAPSDYVELGTALASEGQHHAELLGQLQRALSQDDLFLVSLPPIEEGLLEMVRELNSEMAYCDGTPGAGAALRDGKRAVLGLRSNVITLRLYVAEAGAKRSILLEEAVRGRRIMLLTAFARRTQASLSDIQARIDAIFSANDLYGRIRRWWEKEMVIQGPLRGLTTRELQFREARHAVVVAKTRADDFSKELDALADVPDATRRAIRADLASFRRQLDDQAKKLETAGWRGYLDRQRVLTAQRRRHVDVLPPSCKALLDAFELSAPQVTTEDQFDDISGLYRQQVFTCVTGD
jgi:hypothetical protein